MASDKDRRFPTWRWVAVTAVGILTTLALLAYADTQKKIEGKADKEYVDRLYGKIDQIIRDNEEMKIMLTSHIAATGAGTIPPSGR